MQALFNAIYLRKNVSVTESRYSLNSWMAGEFWEFKTISLEAAMSGDHCFKSMLGKAGRMFFFKGTNLNNIKITFLEVPALIPRLILSQ